MSTSFITALLFAIGSAGWMYTQLSRRTGGGNVQAAVIGTAITAVVVFVFFFTLFKMVIHLG